MLYSRIKTKIFTLRSNLSNFKIKYKPKNKAYIFLSALACGLVFNPRVAIAVSVLGNLFRKIVDKRS